jgi:ABC-type phosphate/phosphonate transport system substrate-binding protein
MRNSGMSLLLFFLMLALILSSGVSYAEQFRIVIMQDEQGVAARFKPLETYLAKKGIEVSLVPASNYSSAANMFSVGTADAMFSGSAVAAIFLMKDLGTPVVRPIAKDGTSTYHAVIVARKGMPKFKGNAQYFKGQRVIFTPLASAGEIFFRSLPGSMEVSATIMKAPSHGAAIEILSQGTADMAIVKNVVWDKLKAKYPSLVSVGEDTQENPDNALIVSKKADAAAVSAVSVALLSLKSDTSPEARAVKNAMAIRGFTKTATADFKYTLELLKKAGVDKSFNFTFK